MLRSHISYSNLLITIKYNFKEKDVIRVFLFRRLYYSNYIIVSYVIRYKYNYSYFKVHCKTSKSVKIKY